VNGAHRRANETPARVRAGQVGTLLAIIAVLASAGLSVYAFVFMFDTVERVAISGCFGIAAVGGAAVVWLPDFTPRSRKWYALWSVSVGIASILFTLLHHATRASVLAPAIFYPLTCAIVLAGFCAGLVAGVSVHNES
jgi:hypothetical protein